MKKCLNCGEDNPEDSKFCNECGSPLKTNLNTNENNPPNNQQISNNPNLNNQQFNRNVDFNNQQPINQNSNNQQQSNNPSFNNQQQSNNPNFNNQSYGKQSLTDKISSLSTPQKVIGVIALCCIGILILAAIGGNSSDQGSLPSNSSYGSSDSSSSYSNNSYQSLASNFNKNECQEISYKELNKNPDKYYGENLKLSGKVFQISEGGSYGNFLLMHVNGEYDQVAYVEYSNDTDIVEDNWITAYGVCEGSYSYSTQIGGSNTVPSLYGMSLEKSS